MRSESVHLLPSSIYNVYSERFYVLFIFCFLAFNQCLIWLTFSPIARSTQIYYNITESTVDLLLNWGPIVFILCLPLTYILLNRQNGLRYCVMLLALIDFLAALVRIIPLVITSPSSSKFTSISLSFLHIGQILNAICGPLVMVPVSQLSCLWFASHERTRATTAAICASNFGLTTSFIIGPLIVSSPEYLPRLLYVHLALTSIACILVMIHFPAQPLTPPSPAAELLITNSTSSWSTLAQNIRQCLTTPAFLLIALAGGLMSGVLGIWTSLFDIILKAENITEQQAGWLGFSATTSGIFGGLCLSIIADRPRFQHSLKTFILSSYFICLLAIIYFELSVHTYFFNEPILPSTILTIGLSTTLVGLCFNSASSLIYESLAELMYPLPESLSASILVQWMNMVSLLVLFIAPNRAQLINVIAFITIMTCLLMIMFARFSYQRRDEDQRRPQENSRHENIYSESQPEDT